MAGVRGKSGKHADKLWRDAIRLAIARRDDGDDKALHRLASKLIDLCEQGDLSALKELGDRLDGKPAQAIVGDDGGPMAIVFRWQNEGEDGQTTS